MCSSDLVTVTTGPSYDTQRMEFVEALVQLSQGNPLVAQGVPDLIIGSMDFPKAEEAAERLKLLLPPPIQQSLQKDAKLPPEVMQAQQQVEMGMQQVEQGMQMLQQAKAETDAERAQLEAMKKELDAAQKVMNADFQRMQAEIRAAEVQANARTLESENKANDAETRADFAAERQQLVDTVAAIQAEAAQTLASVQQVVQQALSMNAQPKPARKTVRVIRDETGAMVGADVEEG